MSFSAGEGQARIRRAARHDLEALVLLEQSFPGDRMTKAGLSRLLASDSAEIWAADLDGAVVGDAVVLFRRGFDSARLYSMVVDPSYRGRGLAKRLLDAAEAGARERGTVVMRLEVREENSAALALYQQAGFTVSGRTDDYYEDHTPALRLIKRFVSGGATVRAVPYYPQSLSFTSGAASLMMAMRYHGYPVPLDRWLELALWREATVTFRQTGHGGVSAEGLAAATLRRGFQARVIAAQGMTDGQSDGGESAEVAELARAGFERELRSLGGKVEVRELNAAGVADEVAAGAVVLALLVGLEGAEPASDQSGRWVAITGFDDDHLYLHDPCLGEGAARADNVHLALRRKAFDRAVSDAGAAASLVLVERWGSLNHRSPDS